jgi:hypothetical protein
MQVFVQHDVYLVTPKCQRLVVVGRRSCMVDIIPFVCLLLAPFLHVQQDLVRYKAHSALALLYVYVSSCCTNVIHTTPRFFFLLVIGRRATQRSFAGKVRCTREALPSLFAKKMVDR